MYTVFSHACRGGVGGTEGGVQEALGSPGSNCSTLAGLCIILPVELGQVLHLVPLILWHLHYKLSVMFFLHDELSPVKEHDYE